jgi:hypothetical protein
MRGRSSFGTIELGELISQLEACHPKARVWFDFCGFAPSGLNSYRGYYDHLALEWVHYSGDVHPNVDSVLATLRAAIGATFQGYKGGDYRMDSTTPVWVSNWGRTDDNTVILGVYPFDDRDVYIVTSNEGIDPEARR